MKDSDDRPAAGGGEKTPGEDPARKDPGQVGTLAALGRGAVEAVTAVCDFITDFVNMILAPSGQRQRKYQDVNDRVLDWVNGVFDRAAAALRRKLSREKRQRLLRWFLLGQGAVLLIAGILRRGVGRLVSDALMATTVGGVYNVAAQMLLDPAHLVDLSEAGIGAWAFSGLNYFLLLKYDQFVAENGVGRPGQILHNMVLSMTLGFVGVPVSKLIAGLLFAPTRLASGGRMNAAGLLMIPGALIVLLVILPMLFLALQAVKDMVKEQKKLWFFFMAVLVVVLAAGFALRTLGSLPVMGEILARAAAALGLDTPAGADAAMGFLTSPGFIKGFLGVCVLTMYNVIAAVRKEPPVL